MALNLESLVNEVPLVWFLGREYDSDIYISNNTLSVGGDDLADIICQYVKCADKYRTYFGVQEKERYVILTDNLNAAKKTSYLFAGDVKNSYFVGNDGTVYTTEGHVTMAEINMHEPALHGVTFPEFSCEPDGALFYGAETEDDIKASLNMILTCDLPFAAVIIDDKLLKTQTVRKLIYDYWFNYLDVRGLGVTFDEAKKLFISLLEDNLDVKIEDTDKEKNKENDNREFEFVGLDMDVESVCDGNGIIEKEALDRMKAVFEGRGSDFREEDLIRTLELIISDEIKEYRVREDNNGGRDYLSTRLFEMD